MCVWMSWLKAFRGKFEIPGDAGVSLEDLTGNLVRVSLSNT